MNNKIEHKDKYYKAYTLMIDKGFLLLTELSDLIGIELVSSIKHNFDALKLYTYDDVLTKEERKHTEYGNKPSCIRALKPIHDKWREEAKQFSSSRKKNGRVITNERGIFNV